MTKLKLLLKQILAYLPSRLPVGLTEMHKFMDDVIEISGKFADTDSMKFAISSMVLRLDSTTSRVSKQYFARALRKAAANQVVSVILNDIKEAQAAAIAEANKLDKQAEATATPQDTASGQTNAPTA